MTEAHTGRIFISYRRTDSAGYAGRLYDRLATHFGKESIFMDVDTIQAGLDFVEVLENAVQSCDVLVALMGRQWLNIKDEEGNRRLDNPQDFVRIEIGTALNRGIRVIPVLVDGTPMPNSGQLPGNLKPLARRNAVLVNHHSFHTDANRLIKQLALALKEAEKTERERKAREHFERREKTRKEKEAAENTPRSISERDVTKTSTQEEEAQEKESNETYQSAVRQKAETTKLTVQVNLFSWLGRMLIGALLGTIMSVIFFIVAELTPEFGIGGFPFIPTFVVSCGLAGIIVYSHKFSILLLALGFIGSSIIGAQNYDFYFVFIIIYGTTFGLPAGALLSRILYWLKVIKKNY